MQVTSEFDAIGYLFFSLCLSPSIIQSEYCFNFIITVLSHSSFRTIFLLSNSPKARKVNVDLDSGIK